MWLRNFLKPLTATPTQRQSTRRRPTASPLSAEALEDRCLPSFSPAVSYPVGVSPLDVVSGDFNNDTVLDLAVANGGTSNVSVLLGNADGTFQPARDSDAGSAPLALAVGDINADGKLDLAVTAVGEVSVLLGDGNGTFQAPISTGIGSTPRSVSVGDFNTDGKLDLVAVWNFRVDDGYGYYGGHYYHDECRAGVLLGTGTGALGAPTEVYRGYNESLLSEAVADFNGDGKLDLAMGSNGGGTINVPAVNVLLGTGTGTFGVPKFFASGGGGPEAVVPADVNNDGKLDLVTANSSSDNVSVLLGAGAGSFGAPQTYAAGSMPQSVATADFNGDGRLDLVTTNGDTGTVSVLLGTGAGTFEPPVSATADSWPYGVVAGDFNGDGRPDVASANNGSNNVSVLLNDGAWPPLPPPPVSINDVTVTEGNTGTVDATFTVTLLYSSPVDVTVHYDTANSTALAGIDYTAVSGDVIIAAGQTSKTFTVAVIGDRFVEPTEAFVVNLSGAAIGDGQGVGTILDDEPRIRVSDVSKKEGNGRTTSFTFTVTLSAAYDQAVTVSYKTTDGTATTGDNDYVAKTGTITFNPGETSKTITIVVNCDRKKESNETFYLDLFGNSSNSLITKSRGIGTILNDD